MPHNLQWTMNCVLFGARIIETIKAGFEKEAIDEIKALSGEFDDEKAKYLLMRLQEI
jgi:hypothetical protein